ncbi:hypothetical protein ACS5PK_17830 [Roseateles sp. DB2]|uniref:hypothetical protein n=1 Tax=Roseateles sp. DB2 TaxID=3453717 RepID=UPI003EEE4E97
MSAYRLLHAAWLLMAAGTGWAAETAPSLRIVTTGHPDPAAYQQNIAVALEACQLKLGLPLSRAGLPPEHLLAAFKLREEERLLDGQMAAVYETMSEVMPDASQGCKLRIARRYRVEIDKTCSWRMYGHSGLLGPDGPGRPSPLTEERSEVPACKPMATVRPATAAAQAKAPRHDAGMGQSCIWDSHTMALLVGEPLKDKGEGGCQWADMPVYPFTSYQGSRRSVPLAHHLDDTTRAGTRLSKAVGAVAAIVDARLTTFEKGGRIAAERFSKAGAESFLAQPRWVNLGDVK